MRLQRNGLTWLPAGLAAAIALAATLGFGSADERPEPRGAVQHFTYTEPSRPVPEVAFVDQAGAAVSRSDFRGGVGLVNFWAPWCPPCVLEIPELNALWEEHRDTDVPARDRLQAALGGAGFTVLVVSIDRGGAKVAAPFLERLGVTRLRTYLDPKSKLVGAFAVVGLPTSILIDRTGREVGRVQGAAEWDTPEAHELIRHFMAAPGPG